MMVMYLNWIESHKINYIYYLLALLQLFENPWMKSTGKDLSKYS